MPQPTVTFLFLTAIAEDGDGLELRTSAPVEKLRYFRLSKPERLVIDLPGAGNGTGQKAFSLARFGLAGARVGTYRGKLRIVIDAAGKAFPPFRVDKGATGVRIALVEAPPARGAASSPAETDQEPLLRFTIEFDTAKAFIRPRYRAMMEKAAQFLRDNPATIAEINGHTDNVGKAHYNVLLSQRRAGSVRKYFVEQYGVDRARIVVRGFGFYKPVASNETESGRQKNRRTEVTITIRKAQTSKPAADETGPSGE